MVFQGRRMCRVEVTLFLMLGLAFMMMIAACHSYASNLPLTITTGVTISTDDTIPTGGSTILDVQSMLTDAASNSLPAAVFEATRTTFDGNLTILLPTTLSAWTTTGIPLRVVILDGTSGTELLPTYVSLTGVLAHGSSITIRGGTYNYTSVFFHFFGGGIFYIEDGSTFTVEGGTYVYQFSVYVLALLVKFEAALVISANSAFSISSNIITTTNVSMPSTLFSEVFVMYNFPITISTNSSLSINNNNIVASNVNVTTFTWMVFVTDADFDVFIDTYSTITISNNHMAAANITVSSNWHYNYLHNSYHGLNVENFSNVSLSGNVIEVMNVSVGQFMSVSVLDFSSEQLLTVKNYSSMIVRNNIVSITSAIMGYYFMLYIFRCDISNSPGSVSTNSSFDISQNTVVVSNVRASYWQWFTLYIPSPMVTFSDKNNIAITNNSMTVTNATALVYWHFKTVLFSDGNGVVTFTEFSGLSIFNNSITVSNFTGMTTWRTIDIGSVAISLTLGSNISISYNKIWVFNLTVGTGSTFWTTLAATAASRIDLFTASSLSITNNEVTARNVAAGSIISWTWIMSDSLVTTIQTTSTMTISNNIMIASNFSVSGIWAWYALYFFDNNAPMYIHATGALFVSGNRMMAVKNGGGQASLLLAMILYLQGGIVDVGDGGHIEVSGNTMSLSEYTAFILPASVICIEDETSLFGSGTVSVHHNSLTSGSTTGTMFSIFGTLGPIIPTIYTCRNYLNWLPCIVSVSSGVFNCSSGLNAGLTGKVDQCSDTHTLSFSSTLNASISGEITNFSQSTSTTITITETSITAPIPETLSRSQTQTTSSANTLKYTTLSLLLQPTSTLPPPPLSATQPSPSTTLRSPTASTTHQNNITSHHPSQTLSTSLKPNFPPTTIFCNYSCADIISLRHVAAGVLPAEESINAHISDNDTTWKHQGCMALELPFIATANGAVARVIIHITMAASRILDSSSPFIVGSVLTTTTQSSMQATVMAANFTSIGLVMAVDIRRTDTNPTTDVISSIFFPAITLLCTSSSGKQYPHNGLPYANIVLTAPPTPLSDGERTAIALTAFTSADLQTVAAIGMLRCSPGSDEDVESEAGIRALVPVALSGTCAGAVQGALLAIGVAFVLSVAAMTLVRAIKRLSWVEAAAVTRCPSIAIAVWSFVQMGLVVCGARLMTADDGTHVALGVVGVVFGALLPVVCIGLVWGVVSRRCYRLSQATTATAGRHQLVVWIRSTFLPSYELDTEVYPVSKSYTTVVSRTCRPSCVWAGLPTIQPVILLVVVFVDGSLCNIVLIIAGVVMMLAGALFHVALRPHRVLASNFLQGFAMALNAALLVIASQLVGNPLDNNALSANSIIALIQVALSLCRALHTVGSVLYVRCFGEGMFVRVNMNEPPVIVEDNNTAQSLQLPTPVFDIETGCCCLAKTPNAQAPGTTHGRMGKLSQSLRSLFNPKTNKQFSDSIVTTLINNKEGGREEITNIATTDRPIPDEPLLHVENDEEMKNKDPVNHDKSSATLSLSFSSSSHSSCTNNTTSSASSSNLSMRELKDQETTNADFRHDDELDYNSL